VAVRPCERGARSPKYLTACRYRSSTCSDKRATKSAGEYSALTRILSLLSFSEKRTVASVISSKRC
jgi:hypothetical protein